MPEEATTECANCRHPIHRELLRACTERVTSYRSASVVDPPRAPGAARWVFVNCPRCHETLEYACPGGAGAT